MADSTLSAIDVLVRRLPDYALTHMLSAVTFEIAKRDKTTPRRVHEMAVQVAPSDVEYNLLRSSF